MKTRVGQHLLLAVVCIVCTICGTDYAYGIHEGCEPCNPSGSDTCQFVYGRLVVTSGGTETASIQDQGTPGCLTSEVCVFTDKLTEFLLDGYSDADYCIDPEWIPDVLYYKWLFGIEIEEGKTCSAWSNTFTASGPYYIYWYIRDCHNKGLADDNPTQEWDRWGIITARACKFDIATDSNNDGQINEQDDPIEENSPGRYVEWNGDDDNSNGTPDKDETGTVTGEDDLAQVNLIHETVGMSDWRIILEASIGGSNIKVWTDSTKGTEITLPHTYVISYPDQIPSTIYVEGYDIGEAMLDMVVKKPANEGEDDMLRDRVKFTVRDTVPPIFTNILADPAVAKLDTLVTITFTASEPLSGNPAVTVNDHSATYSSNNGNDYTYTYTIQSSDDDGDAEIKITGTDPAENQGQTIDTTALDVDKTAPTIGTVTSPSYVTSSPIVVTYSGVSDSTSGLKRVELWYKKGLYGEWADSGLNSPSGSGSFDFVPSGEGVYYFDLVAEDNAGNRSTTPSGDGKCHTIYETELSASGRAFIHTEYLYPGGPAVRTTIHDETGVQVRKVTQTYGYAGELLGVFGDTDAVTYQYDALYRVKSITDGENNTTNYVYDDDGDPNTDDPKIGVVTRVEYPGGDVARFPEHDPAGRILKRIDPNGVTTTSQYFDPENQLTEIAYPSPSTRDVSLKYDSVYGRLTEVTDGTGVRSYAYDNLDVVTGVTTTYTGLPARAVGYEYWPDGSLETVTTPVGNFSFNYDAAGRPWQLTNPYNQTFSWSYYNNDWLQTQTAPVAATSYDYNPRGFLTSLVNRKTDQGQTLLSEFTMPASSGYDAVGNLLSLAANLPNVGSQYSGTTSYQYDSKEQLTLEQSTRNGGYSYQFVYDNASNSTTLRGVGGRTFNANNQNEAFTYNANGNPTTYKGTTLTYDEEDRLISYGTSMSAAYTSDGLRAWKESAGGRIYYLYSGTTPICEMDASGNVTAVNTFGTTGLLARRQGSQDSFYSFDPQGNVSQTLDSAGGVTTTQLYDAYGALLYGDPTHPYGFGAQHGYYTDQETGLQLLTHRYYDPAEGRFLTRDPISYTGGMNLYAYVGNNPVNGSDQLGFCQANADEYPPYWQLYLKALGKGLDPRDPTSTWSRQASSMLDFYRGDWQAAADNSGWALLEEARASRREFRFYTGCLVTAGVAITATISADVAGIGGYEISGIGDYKISWKGGEVKIENPKGETTFRFSPTGHKGDPNKPNPSRERPHYHRRPGIGKHRPWEGGW